ncbi:hypothetical protein FH972_025914 [Carpinus fangiana]|uniref:Uncharacterized protein n=1 Tax=Carpinus fangiana TaxID=176857 RepID=A0A5N6L2E2_9ROSI|nr:hypothetical protein FH972_025914 [Carpinus fangiana]
MEVHIGSTPSILAAVMRVCSLSACECVSLEAAPGENMGQRRGELCSHVPEKKCRRSSPRDLRLLACIFAFSATFARAQRYPSV